ncbi:hypothetical protein COLO4_28583 [Corchorus olitorius]|uniref:Uncharacterized protein n=1 Tax=Corchorus olitorius TaxID=93759 RepID=A0A1R3HJM9_9ROSI|nr:hypothetical protein COLO4_28583 [Corchorus olitorius]
MGLVSSQQRMWVGEIGIIKLLVRIRLFEVQKAALRETSTRSGAKRWQLTADPPSETNGQANVKVIVRTVNFVDESPKKTSIASGKQEGTLSHLADTEKGAVTAWDLIIAKFKEVEQTPLKKDESKGPAQELKATALLMEPYVDVTAHIAPSQQACLVFGNLENRLVDQDENESRNPILILALLLEGVFIDRALLSRKSIVGGRGLSLAITIRVGGGDLKDPEQEGAAPDVNDKPQAENTYIDSALMTKADDGSEAFVTFFIVFVLSRAGFEPALSRCMTQISTFLIVTLDEVKGLEKGSNILKRSFHKGQ